MFGVPFSTFFHETSHHFSKKNTIDNAEEPPAKKAKIDPGGIFGASWHLLGLSDCIVEASCWLLAVLERLFEPPESAKTDFETILMTKSRGPAAGWWRPWDGFWGVYLR